MSELPTGRAPHSVVAPYIDARVTLFYSMGGGVSDTGRIASIDATWVELIKDNGERLLVPIMAIRLLKIVELAKRTDGSDMLLRPADGAETDHPRNA